VAFHFPVKDVEIVIRIIDYGMGNLRSVEKAFASLGCDVAVTRDAAEVERAAAVVLPGVGAFGDAMRGLELFGLTDVTRARALEATEGGRPFFGICLGMQILVERGEEDPDVAGLAVLKGTCPRLRPGDTSMKVPHMGWNRLIFRSGDGEKFLSGLPDSSYVYFVHSYYVAPSDPAVVAAEVEYGPRFCCAVAKGNLFATQFHPEKSQVVGLRILRNFAGLVK